MSKKKKSKSETKTLRYPHYDMEDVLQEISNLCNDYEFQGDKLLALILGDWLTTYYIACKKCEDPESDEPFLSFVASAELHYQTLYKLYQDEVKKD